MATTGESRIDMLSRSKQVPPTFVEDRLSVYWIERFPQVPGEYGKTEFAVTPRLDQLAQPKNSHMKYKGDRATPIWKVNEGAKNATATPRLEELAIARPVHDDYLYHRSVCSDVPDRAKNTEASERLKMLSLPKKHKVFANSNDTIPEGNIDSPIVRVPLPAINGRCTQHIETLAEPKETHIHYKAERPVQWPVSENAKNTEATTRLQQLARPKSGRLTKDDYDPYKVTVGARNARPTPRITELCSPLERKQRQKKA